MADCDNGDNFNKLHQAADCIDDCLESYNRNLLAITLAQILADKKSKKQLAILHQFLIMVANAVRTYMID